MSDENQTSGGATENNPPVAPSTTYPQEITVTLKLKLSVNDPDERDSYLTDSGTSRTGFLADVIDSFMPYDSEKLLTANDLTGAELQTAMQLGLEVSKI